MALLVEFDSEATDSRANMLVNFVVTDGHDRWRAVVILEDLERVRLAWADRSDVEVFEALRQFGVRWLTGGLEAGVVSRPEGGVWTRSIDSAGDGRLMEPVDKTCRFQVPDDGDLFCSASGAHDSTATATLGRRKLAPTTEHTCSKCDLPPTDVSCSSITHVEVVGGNTFGNLGERSVLNASCGLGKSGVDENISRCVAGGHACWHRSVQRRERKTAPVEHPLALHEALDFLNSVWRNAFGVPLLAPTALATAGRLAGDVHDRDQLASRVGDLVTALEFKVSDDLCGDSKLQGGITRMKAALEQAGGDVPDEAVTTLRHVVDVKNSFRHQGKANDLPRHLEALGADPFGEPSAIWAQLRSSALAALRDLRDAVRSIVA